MRRLAGPVALLLALFGCGAATARASPVIVVRGGSAVVRQDPALPPPSPGDIGLPATPPGCRSVPPRPPPGPAAVAGGPTVTAVLSALEREHRISATAHRTYAGVYSHALAVRRRLGGGRGAELGAVIASVQDIARRGALSAGRLPTVFLELQRNAEYWPAHGYPRAPTPAPAQTPCTGKAGLGGARVEFGSDPAVFQWYPGQGLRLQQLAMAGDANALAKACLPGAPSGVTCDKVALRNMLDRIESLATPRGDFLAWEYLFPFDGGSPPWISGLAQATDIQALVHGAGALGDPSYLRFAGRGLGAFEHAPPVGVRVRTSLGAHYLIYSFAPGTRVLNGFLQALIGLYDYAQASGSSVARALFAAGDREARHEVPEFDTGAWSLYERGGAESDLGYHKLVRDFLRNLCTRTHATVYCRTADRFTADLHAHTSVRWRGASPLRAGRVSLARFWMSKVSCVTLVYRAPGGGTGRISAVLARGTHALAWTPRRPGAYALTLEVRDLMNHLTTVRRTVKVRR